MSNWNCKLKCIKDWKVYNVNQLSEGKIYEVKDGGYKYDNGRFSGIYDDFEDFLYRNSLLGKHLIELPEEDLTYLLKTGRVAETRDGVRYLIIRDVDTENYGHQEWGLVNIDGFLTSQDYDINLKEINSDSNNSFDIMKIYQERSINECQLSGNFMDIENKNYLVWERKETIKCISGVQFGRNKECNWILPDKFEDEVSIGTIVKVKSKYSVDWVKVTDIIEVEDIACGMITNDDYGKVIEVIE